MMTGVEGLEAFADGAIDSIGRMLTAYVSPDYAHRAFLDAAERIGRLTRATET